MWSLCLDIYFILVVLYVLNGIVTENKLEYTIDFIDAVQSA